MVVFNFSNGRTADVVIPLNSSTSYNGKCDGPRPKNVADALYFPSATTAPPTASVLKSHNI